MQMFISADEVFFNKGQAEISPPSLPAITFKNNPRRLFGYISKIVDSLLLFTFCLLKLKVFEGAYNSFYLFYYFNRIFRDAKIK